MVIAESLLEADDPEASELLLMLQQTIRKERMSDYRIGEAIVRAEGTASTPILKSMLVRVHNRINEELRSEER